MALSTLKELREALLLLRESEKERQNILVKQIRKSGAKKKEPKKIGEDEEEDLFGPESGEDKDKEKDTDAPEDSEKTSDDGEENTGEEGTDDKASDAEDKGAEAGDKESKKDQALAGAKELNDTPQEIPDSLKGNDFVDRINKIRAGASVKDSDVRDRIVDYVNRLSSGEQNDLYIHLDSLARIILGGVDPAEVITPTMIPKKQNGNAPPVKKQASSKPITKQDKDTVAGPVVVVKEGFKKQYIEMPIVLRTGRTVPYGHKAHIKDTENLLAHLLNYRSCQEPKSADDFAIATAIRIVKKQLASARKKVVGQEFDELIDTVPLATDVIETKEK